MDVSSRHRGAAVLAVIVLLLGGLGLLFAGQSAAESKQILGVVTKEGDPTTLLEGVSVTLVDAHGQKNPLTDFTGLDGKYAFSPSPGFYYVTITKAGFFDNGTEVFRFDGTENLVKNIQMEEVQDTSLTLTVHVEDSGGNDIENAIIELFDVSHEQVLDSEPTNATGNATFSLWAGTFEVRVEKEGFEKSVSELAVSDNTTLIVTLSSGIKLVGLATDSDGVFIEEGLVAYLYNVDAGTKEAKRLLVANMSGSSYTFYAYPGEFILIVDADGKAASITQINVSAPKRIDQVLEDSPEERVDYTIRYVQGDWSNLTVSRELTLNEDSSIPGLPFSFIRNLRLQIDLALGDGNGVLEAAEIDDFKAWLLTTGPKQVDTQGFFTTNSQYYLSDLVGGQTDYAVTVDIPSEGGASISGVANYTLVGGTIPSDQDRYFVNLTAGQDTSGTVLVNYTYAVENVPGYERTVTTTTGSVAVQGFISVLVDPLVASGSFSVQMVLEKSLEGTARVQVLGPAGKFTELNASVDNYTVIVPAGINITFSAEESTDPNSPDGRVSPEANFTWRFTKVSTTIDAYGIRPKVPFQVMGNYSGNLTIIETGGNSTYRDFTLIVDDLLPVARIENNVTGLGTNSNGTTITIKEGNKVRFFGGNSTDQIHDNMTGIVKDWKWDLDGDGKVDATGGTVEWTFSEPGNFTVNLTVIDQGGHESLNATMWVVVEDITSPTVEFSILDTEFNEVTSIMEGKTYYFDASDTTDNLDGLEEMTFQWDFGDGNTTTGFNVSYVYENYGNYEVVLDVTDLAGNVGNTTKNLVVTVNAKARPDLEIETGSLKIDPSSPEESTFFGTVIVTVRFNVSNQEDRAVAENLQVSFWAFRSGESPGDPIVIDPVFYDEDGVPANRSLQPGEKKTVEFTWATGPLGNYTLRVNVTDPREPDLFVGPRNSVEVQIDVREAGWKRPVFIAAIVGVIAGIPVAIYVRRKYRGKAKERITKK